LRSSWAKTEPALNPAPAKTNTATNILPNKANLLRTPARAESHFAQTISLKMRQGEPRFNLLVGQQRVDQNLVFWALQLFFPAPVTYIFF
jgi:hypothetical protein